MSQMCPVCDGDGAIPLGYGGSLTFFPCPACVGMCKADVGEFIVKEAIEYAKGSGVTKLKWIRKTKR